MSNKLSQNEKILRWLQKGNSITQKTAVNMFACYRLSARIANLKAQGYKITTEMETKNGSTYARYRLEEGDQNVQM